MIMRTLNNCAGWFMIPQPTVLTNVAAQKAQAKKGHQLLTWNNYFSNPLIIIICCHEVDT